MKFTLASFGSRGDVEPFAAVARELLRRGHDVQMAVRPKMLGLVESAGLTAVVCGADLPDHTNAAATFARHVRDPITVVGELTEHVSHLLAESGRMLTTLADGADLLLTGSSEQGLAAIVAEYYDIPLAALHFFPAPVVDPGWLFRRITKEAEDAQRRALGLIDATGPSSAVACATLEIQAYDELCFSGPAAERTEHSLHRPFVGALTLELPTEADGEVLSWIAAGTPPIYFGFGSSVRVASADGTVAMISAACADLGERALICAGSSDFADIPQFDHVKVVDAVNHVAVFPACRAVVHHGGAGTTAAAMRAGVPALILWLWLDQPIWGDVVKRLKIGLEHEFSITTLESLVADLRSILTPEYVTRAREVATQMTTPAESVGRTADLLEHTASLGRLG